MPAELLPTANGVSSGAETQTPVPNPAGLLTGDIIIAYLAQTVASIDDLQKLLVDRMVGVPAPLTVLRRADRLVLEIVPVEANAQE